MGNAPSVLVSPNPSLERVRDDQSLPSYIETGHLFLHEYPTRDIEILWTRFLARVDCPDLYCTPLYFSEPYWSGRNPFAILAFSGGEVTGVITGLNQKKEVVCGLPSRPQMLLDTASDTGATAAILAAGLISEFPHADVITAYSWQRVFSPRFEEKHFHLRQLPGDVVLDLRSGAGSMFQCFHENRKRNIRAALRNGVEVSEVTTAQDVADYWQVYCAWQQTGRKKIHAHDTLENVKHISRLCETHRRFIARYKGEPIAATSVRFYPGGLIEYTANCSKDEFIHLRPNDLLIWRTIEWACERGFGRYSLGASHPFLRKCGGTVVPIYRYRLDRTFCHRVELKESLQRAAGFAIRGLRSSRSAAINLFRQTAGL